MRYVRIVGVEFVQIRLQPSHVPPIRTTPVNRYECADGGSVVRDCLMLVLQQRNRIVHLPPFDQDSSLQQLGVGVARRSPEQPVRFLVGLVEIAGLERDIAPDQRDRRMIRRKKRKSFRLLVREVYLSRKQCELSESSLYLYVCTVELMAPALTDLPRSSQCLGFADWVDLFARIDPW